MKNYRLIILLFISLLSLHCRKNGCLVKAGPVEVVQRSATSFYQIDLYDNINLVLKQDTAESIRVETGRNVQPNIATSIEKEILTIRNNASCQWLRDPQEKINVYVSVKELSRLNYMGSGNITSSNTLQAGKISIISNEGAGTIEISLQAKETVAYVLFGNADFTFHGKSDVCFAYANARGSIDFKDFEAGYMHIWYVGVRDAYIHPVNTLDATIFHTGNLYYKGRPDSIITKYHSSGKIYPLP